MQRPAQHVVITRVFNATVLLEFDEGAVLTDPFLWPPRWLRSRERVGLTVDDLPRLAAIVGGHGVYDHWQLGPLRSYRSRTTTTVLVANRRMARAARRNGFADVEILPWGVTRAVGCGLTITSLPGARSGGLITNSYLVESAGGTVFVGTEANDVDVLAQIARDRTVDVALLPVDGTRLLGHRLVLDAPGALEGTRVLGAHTLVPIHYAIQGLPGLLACPSGPDQLVASTTAGVKVQVLPTGTPTHIDLSARDRTDPLAAP